MASATAALALVHLIASATAPADFPPRIQTTAQELGSLAALRFAVRPELQQACSRLVNWPRAEVLELSGIGLDDGDAKVLAFFLSSTTSAGAVRYTRAH